jgi:NitT/TauT family transport system permease protein
LTIVAVLVGEIKLSDKGLGWMTIDAYNHFRLPQMYALLGAIFVVAVGANAVLGRIVQRHYRLS